MLLWLDINEKSSSKWLCIRTTHNIIFINIGAIEITSYRKRMWLLNITSETFFKANYFLNKIINLRKKVLNSLVSLQKIMKMKKFWFYAYIKCMVLSKAAFDAFDWGRNGKIKHTSLQVCLLLLLCFFWAFDFACVHVTQRVLKGTKLEIFGSRISTQIRPVWKGDLGSRPKNSTFEKIVLFYILSPTSIKNLSAVGDGGKKL